VQVASESIKLFNFVTATDVEGYTYTAQDAVGIQLGKSPIQLRYPLVYQNDVNSNPREIILLRDMQLRPFNDLTNPCKDDNSADASCGWVRDQNGDRVSGSQGFCCKCSALSLFGLGSADIRSADAGINCNLFNAQSASAHCMRLDPLWYSVYEVLSPNVDFVVPVSVEYCPASSRGGAAAVGNLTVEPDDEVAALPPDDSFSKPECSSVFVSLSPSKPVHCIATIIVDGRIGVDQRPDAKCNIEVSLEGDFAAWEGTPSFSAKRLVRPSSCIPSSSPECVQRLYESPEWWMLLPITAFGSECDKIGVGWSSFRTQGNQCGMPAQTCLGKQIDDFYEADMEKLRMGIPPDYMLSDLHFGSLLIRDDYETTLRFQTNRYQKTVVNMYISADAISLVRNISPGQIVFADASAFESLSGTGRAQVGLRNLGMVQSMFTVTVSCSAFVEAIPARQITLPVTALNAASAAAGDNAMVNETFVIRVTLETQQAHGCVVNLYDAKQKLVDSRIFNFTTTATVVDRKEQGGTSTGPDESSAVIQQQGYSCEIMCSNWYDAICAFRTGCWQKLLSGALVTFGAILFLVILWRMRRPISKLCTGGSRKRRKKRSSVRYSTASRGSHGQDRGSRQSHRAVTMGERWAGKRGKQAGNGFEPRPSELMRVVRSGGRQPSPHAWRAYSCSPRSRCSGSPGAASSRSPSPYTATPRSHSPASFMQAVVDFSSKNPLAGREKPQPSRPVARYR